MTLIMLLVSLFISVPAIAQDLGGAGAISGFGQGMGRGFESMQSGIIQQGLMQQRQEYELQVQRERNQRDLEARSRQQAEWSAQNQEERDALIAENRDINHNRLTIQTLRRHLMEAKELDPQWYQSEVPAFNKLLDSQDARVEAYHARLEAYHARRAGQVFR